MVGSRATGRMAKGSVVLAVLATQVIGTCENWVGHGMLVVSTV